MQLSIKQVQIREIKTYFLVRHIKTKIQLRQPLVVGNIIRNTCPPSSANIFCKTSFLWRQFQAISRIDTISNHHDCHNLIVKIVPFPLTL